MVNEEGTPRPRSSGRSTGSGYNSGAQEIVDRIGAARELLGLTRIGLAIDLGGIDQTTALEQIDLLATEVLPAITG